MSNNIFTSIAIALIVVANIFWYSAKFFIRSNGLKSDMFWAHLRDFKQLKTLMSDQYSKEINSKAQFYLYAIPLTVIFSIILFFMSAGGHA